MRIHLFIAATLLSLMLAACAASAKKFDKEANVVPEPADGEVAVLGKIRLVEYVVKVGMPAGEQDGTLYLKRADAPTTYKLSCSDSGEFGAYLPSGSYRVIRVNAAGYTFDPVDLTLEAPAGRKAAYAGTLVLDGTPTGEDPDTGDTKFILTVKDEYKELAAALKRRSPGAEVSEADIAKSLFKAGSALALGEYPNKVFRAKDVENELSARSRAIEEVVVGVTVVIPYVLNLDWLITYFYE